MYYASQNITYSNNQYYLYVGVGCKKVRGGQTNKFHQFMKSLTIGMSHVNRCKLIGWGPHDYRNQWLGTLDDMDLKYLQCLWCIYSLCSFES